jgi:hypothetical protein
MTSPHFPRCRDHESVTQPQAERKIIARFAATRPGRPAAGSVLVLAARTFRAAWAIFVRISVVLSCAAPPGCESKRRSPKWPPVQRPWYRPCPVASTWPSRRRSPLRVRVPSESDLPQPACLALAVTRTRRSRSVLVMPVQQTRPLARWGGGGESTPGPRPSKTRGPLLLVTTSRVQSWGSG